MWRPSMSTVILDTITGKSTATTITIGSTPVVSASANSMTIRGEGSAQTSIQQGLSKAWINMNGTGTIAIRDSFNITTIADNAAGRYTPTITNNMSSDDYAGFGGGCVNETTSNNQQARQGPSINVQTTANFQINCGSNTYAQDDWEQPTAGLLGDLA